MRAPSEILKHTMCAGCASSFAMTLATTLAATLTSSLVLSLLVSVSLVGCAASRDRADSPSGQRTVTLADSALGSDEAAGGLASTIDPALAVGAFPSRAGRAALAQSAVDLRTIAQFRTPLADTPAQGPLSAETQALLRQAADALRSGNEDGALAAAEAAQRASPDRVEPLELLLLAQLSRGSTPDVRAVLDKIVIADPRNAIAVAFRGLEAVQRGNRIEALGFLSWFIGAGALPPRGASIPLPTARGEIEDQAALCALAIGAGKAALEALDAADAQFVAAAASATNPSDDTSADRNNADPHAASVQRQLLRADALTLVGSIPEARLMLEQIAGDETQWLAVRAMAQLRLDALADSSSEIAERLEAACATPISDVALWRTTEAVARVFASTSARTNQSIRDAAWTKFHAHLSQLAQSGDRRAALLRDVLDARSLTVQACEACLERCVADGSLDSFGFRMAVRAALRVHAAVVFQAIELLLEKRPELVDLAAQALLSGPYNADQLTVLISKHVSTCCAEALSSRILALYGFNELALSKAMSALARDPAAALPLAAAIYSASELGDGTFLLTLEESAREAGCKACPALFVAWTNMGDRARAAQFEPPFGPVAERGDSKSETFKADRLAADATRLLGARLTIGDEALLLVDAIAPRLRTLELLRARIGTATEPIGLARTCAALQQSWPGRPAVEAFAFACADDASRATMVDGGVRSEFLRRQQMSLAERQALALEAVRMRPRTPEAIATEALALLAAGDAARAAELIENASRVVAPTISSQGATGLLRAAAQIAKSRRDEALRMARATRGLVDRVVFLEINDVADAVQLAVLSGLSFDDMRALAARCARMTRTLDAAKLPQVYARLRELVELDGGAQSTPNAASALGTTPLTGDPYPAALLAAALARESRHDADVRAALARTSVALFAVAGGSERESEELVEALVADGIAPFASRTSTTAETPPSVALMLLRASDVHALLGDDAGSGALLRASLERDPALPSALNNLAYRDLQACLITDETKRMAEGAASLEPSNPSILDTLGLLRLSEGQLRDGPEGLGALTLFRQALRLNPENPSLEALDHLGDALWRDGDQQGAVRCWQQVSQLAELRYPPEGIARRLIESQRAEFGLELVDPAEYVRRSYGAVVDRAALKVEAVAKGMAPRVFDCPNDAPR
jgi:tetratricopeptide (TPR) repeat protein